MIFDRVLPLGSRPHRQDGTAAAPSPIVVNGLGLELYAFDTLEAAAPLWDEIDAAAVGSAFQSYIWLSAWTATGARLGGEQPLIVAGRSGNGQLRFVLPLSTGRRWGADTLRFLGQDHANYNLGLYEPDFQAHARPWEMRTVLAALAARRSISAVHFDNQPRRWNGMPNPLAGLPGLPSANDSFEFGLASGIEDRLERLSSARTRATLRRKHRKLEASGVVSIASETDPDQRDQVLDAFFDHKTRQLRRLGLSNAFASANVREFYALLADQPDGLDVRTLRIGGRLVAIELMMQCGARAYLLNSVVVDDTVHDCSPGTLLLHEDVAAAVRAGLDTFDLGPGAAAHKQAWKPATVSLATTSFAFDARGLPVAALNAGGCFTKRAIKGSPLLWRVTRSLRRALDRKRS